jgi:hypothetical protein
MPSRVLKNASLSSTLSSQRRPDPPSEDVGWVVCWWHARGGARWGDGTYAALLYYKLRAVNRLQLTGPTMSFHSAYLCVLPLLMRLLLSWQCL